jgi:hypothetical protein
MTFKKTLQDPEKRRLELEMICKAGLDAIGGACNNWTLAETGGLEDCKESSETTQELFTTVRLKRLLKADLTWEPRRVLAVNLVILHDDGSINESELYAEAREDFDLV